MAVVVVVIVVVVVVIVVVAVLVVAAAVIVVVVVVLGTSLYLEPKLLITYCIGIVFNKVLAVFKTIVCLHVFLFLTSMTCVITLIEQLLLSR
jgi:hypothetical protein